MVRNSSLTMLAGMVIALIGMMNLATVPQPAQLETPFDVVHTPEPVTQAPAPVPALYRTASQRTAAPLLDDPTSRTSLAENSAFAPQDASRRGERTAPVIQGWTPERLVIPSLGVDASIMMVNVIQIDYEGQVYEQWQTPENEVGWHGTSALLGMPGNTVLNGHHNTGAMVFKNLTNLRRGDEIVVYSGDQSFHYVVDVTMLLAEKYRSLEERLDHARWTLPTSDERLTLITCWPPESNIYRVIVVAYPKK